MAAFALAPNPYESNLPVDYSNPNHIDFGSLDTLFSGHDNDGRSIDSEFDMPSHLTHQQSSMKSTFLPSTPFHVEQTHLLPTGGFQNLRPLDKAFHSNPSSSASSPVMLDPSGMEQHYSDLWLDGAMSLNASDGDLCYSMPCLTTTGLDFSSLLAGEKLSNGFVDPTMMSPNNDTEHHSRNQSFDYSPSSLVPALHDNTLNFPRQISRTHSPLSKSPSTVWQVQPGPRPQARSPQASIRSIQSPPSHHSPQSTGIELDEDGREKSRCPYPDCGKAFKDLKAHLLTHQYERPEKCPIVSCEFHKRGFARKYDRNRHLVTTHYKSTIVCGFCPGSGTSKEKTFNRTDVFKRHLVSVHGVEQNPPNGRKKSSASSSRASPTSQQETEGKCSTCGAFFASAQELFEHVDDCVLRVVQQIEPSEVHNERLLRSVLDDANVKETMEHHMLSNNDLEGNLNSLYEDENDSEGTDDVKSELKTGKSGKGGIKTGNNTDRRTSVSSHAVADGRVNKQMMPIRGKGGVTYSKGGFAMQVGKARKRRKHYPQSWGCTADKMKLKKRVLCVFDGQRRLWKDDMMLGSEYEVRMKLGNGEHYVTDLDVETMKRAEAFHSATQEERGPWIMNNFPGNFDPAMQRQPSLSLPPSSAATSTELPAL